MTEVEELKAKIAALEERLEKVIDISLQRLRWLEELSVEHGFDIHSNNGCKCPSCKLHKKVDDHIFQYNQLLDNVPGLAADPIYNVAEIGENNVEQYVIDNQDKLFGKFRTYDYLGMHYTKIGKQP